MHSQALLGSLGNMNILTLWDLQGLLQFPPTPPPQLYFLFHRIKEETVWEREKMRKGSRRTRGTSPMETRGPLAKPQNEGISFWTVNQTTARTHKKVTKLPQHSHKLARNKNKITTGKLKMAAEEEKKKKSTTEGHDIKLLQSDRKKATRGGKRI